MIRFLSICIIIYLCVSNICNGQVSTQSDSTVVYANDGTPIRFITPVEPYAIGNNSDSLMGRRNSTKKRILIAQTDLPISTATQTALNLKSNIANPAFTGNVTTSGTLGFQTGQGTGGTVTQLTSKSTGVTLNKIAGDITMNGAALAAATIISFTLTNSTISATDMIPVQHQATGTFGAYTITGRCAAGSAVITIRNNTAGSLSEAIVIRFAVIKSTTN